MKFITILIASACLFLTNCEDQEQFEGFDASIKNDINPFVLNSDDEYILNAGQETEASIDLKAPWARISPVFKNTGTDVITISNATAYVTGPDGVTRERPLKPILAASGTEMNEFSIVYPNCNDSTPPASSESCGYQDLTFIANNSNFGGAYLFLTDMLEGLNEAEIETYGVGASYSVEVLLRGSVGPPNNQTANFISRFYFTAVAN